jgi:hypothetical protein
MEKASARSKRPRLKDWLFSLAVLTLLAIILVATCPRRHTVPSVPPGLLPKEADAIKRALGPDGLDRVSQVISPQDRPSVIRGGTHMMSGIYNGKPYGLAFDIIILSSSTADADVHKLRMQGIAAWRRGHGAPGGANNLMPHIHCVWPGAPTTNVQNREQISSFVHRYKGTVEAGGSKATWRDPTITPAEIQTVTQLYVQVYGPRSLRRVVTYESRHHAAYMSKPVRIGTPI